MARKNRVFAKLANKLNNSGEIISTGIASSAVLDSDQVVSLNILQLQICRHQVILLVILRM
jgi:hypothetical protein